MSPSYVDKIGRAFEKMVVAALSPTRDNLTAKDRVLKELFRKYAKQYGGFHGRLKVAVDEAVAQVRQIVQGRPIRSVEERRITQRRGQRGLEADA